MSTSILTQHLSSDYGDETGLGDKKCEAVWSRFIRTQEMCERRGGRPGLPVLNGPYSLCGREATLEESSFASPNACRLSAITSNAKRGFMPSFLLQPP